MTPVCEVLSEDMKNPGFTVIVYPYALGQFRIQVTELRFPSGYAPEGHGSIAREL